MHSPHSQMGSVGMPQVMETEIGNGCPPASRSEAVLNIPHVPPVPFPENITRLVRHLQEDSKEGVIDRDYPDGVVLCNGQDD